LRTIARTHCSLCTGSSTAGARRGCYLRILCRCSSVAGLAEAASTAVFTLVPPPLVLADAACCRSLYTCSSHTGAHRDCCLRSVSTCSSAAGTRTRQRLCGTPWLQNDVVLELWAGPVIDWVHVTLLVLAAISFLSTCSSPPRALPCPQIVLGTVPMLHILGTVLMLHIQSFPPQSPSTLSFPFPFLLSCP